MIIDMFDLQKAKPEAVRRLGRSLGLDMPEDLSHLEAARRVAVALQQQAAEAQTKSKRKKRSR